MCFSFDKTSEDELVFSRDVRNGDLIQMAGGESLTSDSLDYNKHEESVIVNKVLQKSRGKLKMKLDFGEHESDDLSSDDVDKDFDFGKEFASNGTYVLEKDYCKQRSKRNIMFADLKAPNIKRSTLLATIDLS